MPINIDSAIQRIKIYAFAVRGWSKKELALHAKVSENSLRHIHESRWNVSLGTVRKLESVIPADWDFIETPELFNNKNKDKRQ